MTNNQMQNLISESNKGLAHKAIRVFSIANNDDSRERLTIGLYAEKIDGEKVYAWKHGPLGDSLEEFPVAKTVKKAMQNAIAAWSGSIWKMKATWI